MAKSELNRLSKRQILESLYQEQSQGNATLSRLVTALARSLNVNPEELAKNFHDNEGNQAYVVQFNNAIGRLHSASVEDHSGHDHGSEEVPQENV